MDGLWVLTYVPTPTSASVTIVQYLQSMLKDPPVAAPTTILLRDIDGIFVDYHELLVLHDVRSVSFPHALSMIYKYFQWFYIASHPYVKLMPERDSIRPALREILEEDHTMANYVMDVLSICHHIIAIERDAISRR